MINMNVEENVETKVDMNIYEKLTNIQNDLLEMNIPKSGKNNFGGFAYYELDDLLPPILMLCKQYSCTLFFSFPFDIDAQCYKGVLNLVNWENPDDKLFVEVPFPELEKLPKMNWAQSSGTYQTYMKRYLILHTFDIMEEEIIDSTEYMNELTKQNNGNKETRVDKATNGNGKKKVNITKKPVALQKVIDRCKEENPDVVCDKKLLNTTSMKMFKNKEITQKERKEIYDYLKKI